MKPFSSTFFTLFSAVAGVWLCAAMPARAAVDTVTAATDSGPGSLRNTITAAGSGDTIVFSPTLAGQTIQLTSGELFIGQNLTIDALALPGGVVIDGGGSGRVLEIGGANVTFKSLTITNGYVSDDAGAGVLLDDSTTSLTTMNCVFSGNSAEFGGAITAYGMLTLENCTISNNFANVYGGGIFCAGGAITGSNCTFIANSVPDGGGGAIESQLSGLTLENCTVSGNVASFFGGGIDSEDEGTLYLTNCMFLNNSSGTAGALSVETPATVIDCTFYDNASTNGAGGGIANYDTLALNDCTFFGNSVANNNSLGGGLLNSGILTMNNCTFLGNSAPNGSGGGVYNSDILAAYNCTFSGNSAANGNGGGLASFTATNVLVNCTICSNSAGHAGGLVDVGSSVFELTNTAVAGNAAATSADIAASYSGLANFIGGNPQLVPLARNGGPTQTMPPLFYSPLIDAGADWVTNILATDQRGYPRRAGAHVDIGAVETQPAPANNPPLLGNVLWSSGGGEFATGVFRFSFTNVPNADFTVLTSTNLTLPLAEWTVLGNAQQAFFPGNYEFLDSIAATVSITRTNYTDVFPLQQYYRVVSP